MRAPLGSVEGDMQTVYAGGQAFRHGGCSHVCYLDGHVAGVCDRHEGMHAEDSPLRQVMLEQIMGFPQNAFLADDDRPYDPR
jgi:prepilin-type processing-associated H-X9-DG protein